jgi:hypothetical protein
VPNQKQIDKMFKAIKNFQENNKNYLMIWDYQNSFKSAQSKHIITVNNTNF